jgi:hypothetical protein
MPASGTAELTLRLFLSERTPREKFRILETGLEGVG